MSQTNWSGKNEERDNLLTFSSVIFFAIKWKELALQIQKLRLQCNDFNSKRCRKRFTLHPSTSPDSFLWCPSNNGSTSAEHTIHTIQHAASGQCKHCETCSWMTILYAWLWRNPRKAWRVWTSLTQCLWHKCNWTSAQPGRDLWTSCLNWTEAGRLQRGTGCWLSVWPHYS